MPKAREAAPVDHFTDGGVWQVVVDHRSVGPVFGHEVIEPKEYLVLVRFGVKRAGAWARTKLAVGDLRYRTTERVFADFVRLMRQPRPVPANYLLDLNTNRGDQIHWIAYKGDCHG